MTRMTPDDTVAQVAVGRTWLFTPGNRADRFDKARASGPDAVICDLEDAVDPSDKTVARDAVAGWLAAGGSAWVRINASTTEWVDDDIAALRDLDGLRGVMVPKAENPAVLQELRSRLGSGQGLIALVESARGIHAADQLASCDAVDRLAFGSIDYAADIRAEHTDTALLFARSALVLASRVADKPAPIDGVTVAVKDAAAVEAAARYATGLGFGGKLCIHPAQLAPVNAAFAPGEDDRAWAQRVMTAAQGTGAGLVDGQMIDKAVMLRAQQILDAAEAATTAGTVS